MGKFKYTIYNRGSISPIFFQNFFYEYFVLGIVPPFSDKMTYIGGAYGGGEGYVRVMGGVPGSPN